MKSRKTLTLKQQAFVYEYLIDLNATQAATRAGYSAKTAYSIGEENLRKPEIKNAIATQMKNRMQRVTIDSDAMLERLVGIDNMDLLDIMNDDMTTKPLSEWPDVWRKTISSIEVIEQLVNASDGSERRAIIKKIKLPDKQKNLEMLGKHVDVQAWRNSSTLEAKPYVSLGDLMKEVVEDRKIYGAIS